MSINVKTVGVIEEPLGTTDEFQVTFTIATWLDTDAISSVAYSATDELGEDASSDVLDALKHANTTTVIKPYIKGGGTNNKQYTVKMIVTTTNSYIKVFYIKFNVINIEV